jgi:hypothetical protein
VKANRRVSFLVEKEQIMAMKQGDLALLNEPLAQELLHSTVPARLAYVWSDGTPRVIPIWFHWTGEEIVLCSPSTAPKMKILAHDTQVALTIDYEAWPARVLLIRGPAHSETIDGEIPEYAAITRRYLGAGAIPTDVSATGAHCSQARMGGIGGCRDSLPQCDCKSDSR